MPVEVGDPADRLRRVLTEMSAAGLLEHVRVDEWWDRESGEVWLRTTESLPVRVRVVVSGGDLEVTVRGPWLMRLRRPPLVRELLRRLRADS